jgi:hypothetical protein
VFVLKEFNAIIDVKRLTITRGDMINTNRLVFVIILAVFFSVSSVAAAGPDYMKSKKDNKVLRKWIS